MVTLKINMKLHYRRNETKRQNQIQNTLCQSELAIHKSVSTQFANINLFLVRLCKFSFVEII